MNATNSTNTCLMDLGSDYGVFLYKIAIWLQRQTSMLLGREAN
jgi:hypothetical protein